MVLLNLCTFQKKNPSLKSALKARQKIARSWSCLINTILKKWLSYSHILFILIVQLLLAEIKLTLFVCIASYVTLLSFLTSD
jgi:hypothetical protein